MKRVPKQSKTRNKIRCRTRLTWGGAAAVNDNRTISRLRCPWNFSGRGYQDPSIQIDRICLVMEKLGYRRVDARGDFWSHLTAATCMRFPPLTV